MLKAVIFDVDGVLVDSKNANVALFQAILERAGYPAPSREQILEHFHLPLWQSLEKLIQTANQKEVERVWKLAHDPSLRNGDLLEFPEKLEHTLETLHKKYKLAIVTGRIKVGIEDIFSAKEIKHMFDVVVTFEDYKNPKPHPEPLYVALKKLGVKADEAIYIGDSDSDIEAAKAAGMRSIHLSHATHNHATVGVTDFNQLLEAVDNLAKLPIPGSGSS